MAGSISDIDARKRAEEALRASEEQYREIFNAAADAFVLRDGQARVVDVNPAFLQISGYSREEVVSGTRWIFALPEHADVAREMHRRCIAGEAVRFEMKARRKDGSLIDVEMRAVRVMYRGVPHALGMARDITAQKRAEAERARLEGQLLQAKKLEAIGTLAGGIAHDFNNILSATLGYGEMAQKQAPAGTSLRRHIDAVVSAGMRAKSLVERILAFSRSGIGERRAVRVQSVVAEALDLLAASLPAHVKLERELAAEDAAVMGDPTQIHQVVMNLCANGAQAMKSAGTLTVSLDVVQKADSVAATSAIPGGRYVRLRVHDTGSGIAPNVMERIFDPFFTTKGVGVGTGLGLSLVHGIVTDLGGGIDVESAPGQGSTFVVYLPWTDAAVAPASAEEVIAHGDGETILLVDDEEPLVRLGEEVVAQLGYEPVGFSSSTAALEAFRAEPQRFHAVLTDESMPEMTGSELVRAIRALRPDIPILMMTGFVTPALSARSKELGVVEVLSKPLVTRDIARGLAAALCRATREAA
jgi:PAS domain S-box-containing protein